MRCLLTLLLGITVAAAVNYLLALAVIRFVELLVRLL